MAVPSTSLGFSLTSTPPAAECISLQADVLALMASRLAEDELEEELELRADSSLVAGESLASLQSFSLLQVTSGASPTAMGAPVPSSSIDHSSSTSTTASLAKASTRPQRKIRAREAAWRDSDVSRARRAQRDLQRAQAFGAKRGGSALMVEATVQPASQPRTGEYRGRAERGRARQPTLEVPAGTGPISLPAAVVTLPSRKLFVWRSYGYANVAEVDLRIQAAAQKLVATTRPEIQPGHSRGAFPMRQFMIHRSYTSSPRNNRYLLQNLAAAQTLASDLADVVRLVNDIFKARFPRVYDRYMECLGYIVNHASLQDTPIYRLWGAFASLSVNAGGKVWTIRHKDADNYFAGLCVVVGFGPYDSSRSAKLVIELGAEAVALELPPGIPLFLPSSVFAHYNTRVVGGDEVRGSLVFWTSGKLFQWVDLGGCCRKDLSPEEVAEWALGQQERLRKAFELFPDFPLT